jgi:hypothetical protein
MEGATMYKITDKQVKDALDKFEWAEYYNTGMKHINGGYAKAEIFDYDDEYFDVQLEYGEQDMGSGYSTIHREQYKMNRETLEITD